MCSAGLRSACGVCGWHFGARALRVYREVSHTATNIRTYDFDWLIAVLLVYVLLLLIGALRKRLRSTALSATIAFILVVAGVLLFTQLGIKNTNI